MILAKVTPKSKLMKVRRLIFQSCRLVDALFLAYCDSNLRIVLVAILITHNPFSSSSLWPSFYFFSLFVLSLVLQRWQCLETWERIWMEIDFRDSKAKNAEKNSLHSFHSSLSFVSFPIGTSFMPRFSLSLLFPMAFYPSPSFPNRLPSHQSLSFGRKDSHDTSSWHRRQDMPCRPWSSEPQCHSP